MRRWFSSQSVDLSFFISFDHVVSEKLAAGLQMTLDVAGTDHGDVWCSGLYVGLWAGVHSGDK
jgi:hypothetical protein